MFWHGGHDSGRNVSIPRDANGERPCLSRLRIGGNRTDSGNTCRSRSGRCAGTPPPAWGQRLLTRVFRSLKTVHPHSRGDNCGSSDGLRGFLGTPPLAWGQQRVLDDVSGARRYTPTRVGTTKSATQFCDRFSVHPHSRGDNLVISHGKTKRLGTPPLAWGQHLT